MQTSLFKTGVLAACASLLMVGCSTTPTQSTSNMKTVELNAVSADGIGASVGTFTLQDSPVGLIIQTNLNHLPIGPHGFHIHEKGSCEPAEKDGKMVAALAAGGHYNPTQVAHHGTPMTGHLGDLPVLHVNSAGQSQLKLIAPRLKLADIQGHAMMIHAGGDNYSDQPKPLGGGGDRIACGVI